jgi:hypothetical protein
MQNSICPIQSTGIAVFDPFQTDLPELQKQDRPKHLNKFHTTTTWPADVLKYKANYLQNLAQ